MVIDSSAIVALLRAEDDAPRFAAALALPGPKRLSVANYLEAALVLDRGRPSGGEDLDALVDLTAIELVPVSVAHARLAREAHARYGRGTGHPARLDFGDCFAYALARALDAPLLFKGADFARTDVVPALPSEAGA